MRTFTYPLGHVRCTTMTVSELRARLSEFPDDMPVMVDYERERAAIPWAEEGLFKDGDGSLVPVLVLSGDGY